MNPYEAGRPGDPKPTSQKYNAALRYIILHFPSTYLEPSDFVFPKQTAQRRLDDETRRQTSETKVILIGKARDLLTNSFLTFIGIEIVIEHLIIIYDLGIYENPYDDFTRTLEIDKVRGGGVFDQERTKRIEPKLYRGERDKLSPLSEMWQDYLKDADEEQQKRFYEVFEDPEKDARRSAQWRIEIIEKHDVDPEKPTSVHQARD